MTITRIGEKNYSAFGGILPYEKMPFEDTQVLMIGIIEDGKAAAAAALLLQEETAVIESVYVVPEYRRKGFGSALMGAEGSDKGCGHSFPFRQFRAG